MNSASGPVTITHFTLLMIKSMTPPSIVKSTFQAFLSAAAAADGKARGPNFALLPCNKTEATPLCADQFVHIKGAVVAIWQRLQAASEVFQDFSEQQRDSFLQTTKLTPRSACAVLRRRSHVPQRRIRARPVLRAERRRLTCSMIPHGRERAKSPNSRAGRFYGELGAIGGLPRTLDIVADGARPKSSMSRGMRSNTSRSIPHARVMLAERYRERAVRVAAAGARFVSAACRRISRRTDPEMRNPAVRASRDAAGDAG